MPEKDSEPVSESELDPGASTQMFQAFVERHDSQETQKSWRTPLWVGVGLVGLVVVAGIAWLLLGG